MSLFDELHRAGGIMPAPELRERGYGERALRSAVAEGRLLRPRRGWLALPDADPELLLAARYGVLLTCVTAARRLGLWTREREDRPHVGVRHGATHVEAPGCRRHWRRPVIPRPPHALVDSTVNALAHTAECLPRAEAVAVWESALERRLVSAPALHRLPLGTAARAVLDECELWVGSGLETYVRRRLRALGLKVQTQSWILGRRVDLLVEDWLVIEIDGGTHVGSKREEDVRADAWFAAHGYFVIRVGYHDVMERWPDAQERIMLALAQGPR